MKEKIYKSSIGDLRLIAKGFNLIYCNWEDEECSDKLRFIRECALATPDFDDEGIEKKEEKLLREAEEELDLYFKGLLTEFTIPVSFYGTDFQRDVWIELSWLDYGTTISYKELGNLVGLPNAARAVANACAANPLAIMIPCHRVVKSDGELGGYTGGIFRKKFLLTHEESLRSRINTGF